MTKQKEIGAVLTFESLGYKGVCGQTVGADGRGSKAVIFYGNPHEADTEARKYIKQLSDHIGSRNIKNVLLVVNEEEYMGFPVTEVDVT